MESALQSLHTMNPSFHCAISQMGLYCQSLSQIQGFDFQVKNKPGRYNACDYLSSHPLPLAEYT